MKGKTLSTIGVIFAAIGALLIFFYKSITPTQVVIAGGALFIGVGLINLIIFDQSNKSENEMAKVFSQIANAAAIVFGICMLVFNTTFASLVTVIFGLLIAVCALWQFFLLAIGTRPYQLPAWLYLFPVLLTAGTIYVFMQKASMDGIIILATGIAMAVLGLACIIEGSALGVARRKDLKKTTKNDTENIAAQEEIKPENQIAPKAEKTSNETTEDLDAPLKTAPESENTTK